MELQAESIFQLLLAEAKKRRLPKSGGIGMTVCDRRDLAELKPKRFVWCLREHGTWLLLPNEKLSFEILAMEHHYGFSKATFWYDDGKLTEVPLKEAWVKLLESSSIAVQSYARSYRRDGATCSAHESILLRGTQHGTATAGGKAKNDP